MTGLRDFRPSARVLLAFSGALFAVTACTKAPARPARAPMTVAVTLAKRVALPYTIDANGTVMPLQTAVVATQVDGIVTDVTFREGQEVSKGQVLFKIDPRPYQAAYDQAQALLARDKATLENARKDLDRYEQLVKSAVVTVSDADLRRATFGSAQAIVEGDMASLATAKFNLDNTTVRAPIAGRTGGLLVRTGNLVRAGGATPLVVINQVRPILVRFAVPGSALPMVLQYGAKGGLPVTAVPGDAVVAKAASDTTSALDAAADPPGQTVAAVSPAPANPDAAGSLSFIDNAVDTTTGTVQLRAQFANKGGTLWAGQFVNTSLRLFVEDSALVVPSQCVVTGQQGAFVYVIDSDNKAQQHKVKVERQANGLSVIASGVNAGDRVVTDGQARLTPGAQVDLRTGRDSTGGGGRGGRGGRGGGRGGRGRGQKKQPEQ